tara:strand:+ start:343 stop:1041 length:699 start_codon:yes stop_codon:yes gene_type:complete
MKNDLTQLSGIPHVLVIDDDRRLRLLLKDYLSENGFLVSTSESAGNGREKMEYFSFDILVVDVMMEGETGLEFMRTLRSSDDIPILLLTAMGESEDRIRGLASGADDYLTKPFEPQELVLRLQAILRRSSAPRSLFSERIIFGDFVFDDKQGQLRKRDEPINLTSGELSLLRVFTKDIGLVVSRGVLASRAGIEERTVDVQIARLRRKIEHNPRLPQFLITVRGEGYVLRER